MAVIIENSKDKITDEKIRILYKDEFKKNNITIPNKITLEDIKDGLITKELAEKIINYTERYTKEYENLTQKEKDKLREKFFEELIEDLYNYNDKGQVIHTDIHYYIIEKYNLKVEDEEGFDIVEKEKILKKLREELYYNLDEFFNFFYEKYYIEKESKLNRMLEDWKVLNDLRPHPEYINLFNVYMFFSKLSYYSINFFDKYLNTFLPETFIYKEYKPIMYDGKFTRNNRIADILIHLLPFVVDIDKEYKRPTNYNYFFYNWKSTCKKSDE